MSSSRDISETESLLRATSLGDQRNSNVIDNQTFPNDLEFETFKLVKSFVEKVQIAETLTPHFKLVGPSKQTTSNPLDAKNLPDGIKILSTNTYHSVARFFPHALEACTNVIGYNNPEFVIKFLSKFKKKKKTTDDYEDVNLVSNELLDESLKKYHPIFWAAKQIDSSPKLDPEI
ncbi:hypothetical protein HK096_003559, partial [Nowakowskiella sp. JEL0078]